MQTSEPGAVESAASTPSMPAALLCRGCSASLEHVFADLGMSPLSNAYLTAAEIGRMEPFYPLCAYVCRECLLVQLQEFERPEAIFGDYLYFSSFSETWLEHARAYVEMIVSRFGIGPEHRVVELASNDGYLLQYFVERGVPVMGIEPARNVAEVASRKGIRTLAQFFGEGVARQLAAENEGADLIVGNNVLAHVPDLNDFVEGMKVLLNPLGVITLEFPHLLRLVEGNQFDTIYHEHFSYFSYLSVSRVLEAHGLVIFDVDELPTHGGSLRIYVCHEQDPTKSVHSRVSDLIASERAAGMDRLETYLSFGERVRKTKRKLLTFLVGAREDGKSIVGYGAPAKGNTLLNYCGIRTDFIDYTVDRSPHKQGRFLPGTHIPISSPDRIRETRPDYLLILPWNLADEITRQMACIREWGGRFVVPIPEVRVF